MAMTKDCSAWLSLAAAPSFAAMASVTALNGPDLCHSASSPLPIDSMAGMYLLMTIFHLPPWLRLIPRLAGNYRNQSLTEKNQ